MKVNVILKDGGFPLIKSTLGSAGYDIASSEDVIVLAGKSALVKTGIFLEIENGYEAQIRSRSGLAFKKNVMVLNSPGTIDSDYRGEIGVLLMNFGSHDFDIKKGDRIAQLIFAKYESPVMIEVDSFDETKRGDGGWGSSGI
jgi:dUTP pyrophosphatase